MTTTTTQQTRRVAVVTGASCGIGHAVARRLAADGMSVVVGHAGNATAADKTVTAITAAGGTAIAVRADVADETAVSAMFDRAETELGGVDVVVNAAGRMTLEPVAELDLDALDAMHRTNIRGTFVVAQQAAPGCGPAAPSSASRPRSSRRASRPTPGTPRPRPPSRR